MEGNKARSYAKESTKSKPTGVRFDIEKSDFVKGREKLNTFQKVVDFLLNKYWWDHKIAKPSHKEVPPSEFASEIKYAETTDSSFDGSNTKIHTIDEPLSFDKMKSAYLKPARSFDSYRQARIDCESQEQWLALKEEIMNDVNLSTKQKSLLTT